MKKFLPQFGGHRVYLDDFRLMQDSYIECLAAIAGMFTNNTNSPMVMSGCNRLTGFLVGGVQHYPYSPGYVFFNGEIFKFEGTTDIDGSNLTNHFLKINETILPPSPVEYKDQSNKDAHFSRTLVIKNFDSADGDLENVNGFYYRNMVQPKLEPSGIVQEWYPSYVGEENDVFDSNGLGIGRMYGYQICNGKLGTPDLRGLFTIMPSVNMKTTSALTTPAAAGILTKMKYGVRTSVFTVTQANLPNYNLTVNENSHFHYMFDSTASGGDRPPATNSYIYWSSDHQFGNQDYDMVGGASGVSMLGKTSNEKTNISVNSAGSGNPLSVDNLPPSYGMIKIMKLNL